MAKTVLLFVCLAVLGSGFCHAAVVDVPLGARGGESFLMKSSERVEAGWSEDMYLRLGVEFDSLSERDLETCDIRIGNAEGNFIQGKCALSYKKIIDVYGIVGGVFDLKYKTILGGGTVPVDYGFEESMVYGFGVSSVLYEIKPKFRDGVRVCFFADINCRFANKMEYDSLETLYGSHNGGDVIDPKVNGEWTEWHYALGASFPMGTFTPYVGGKFSRAEAKATASVLEFSAIQFTYATGNSESEDSWGAFAGFIVTPAKGVSFEAQGRFFDEEAVTAAITLGF